MFILVFGQRFEHKSVKYQILALAPFFEVANIRNYFRKTANVRIANKVFAEIDFQVSKYQVFKFCLPAVRSTGFVFAETIFKFSIVKLSNFKKVRN